MADLRLTLAMSDYLHTQDLASGVVRPVGMDLTVLNMPFETLAMRFERALEWEISEFSLAGYCALVSRSDRPAMIALPVFPSRMFRQHSIYISADSGISSVYDLSNRRVGIPQWVQTAGIYVRGWLSHDIGIPLSDITWVQAGLHTHGRADHVDLRLPEGTRIERLSDATLDSLLLSGDIDAVISARPPRAFVDQNPSIRHLYPDYTIDENRYFEKARIFPIMHVIVVRRDAADANPWILRNLYEAFEVAKANCFARLNATTTSFLPTAWASERIAATNAYLFPDSDPWPYGIEPNRRTLEAFLMYCFEQGVTTRELTVNELFPQRSLAGITV